MNRPHQSRRPDHRRDEPDDTLPPHSSEAELAVLGCIVLECEQTPAGQVQTYQALREVRLRFGAAQPFYDLRHDVIFTALCHMADEGIGIDVITLHERLKVNGNLDRVGGLNYIAELPNQTPSVANLAFYLDIVWGHYITRVSFNALRSVADQVLTAGATEGVLGGIAARIAELQKAATPQCDGTVAPPHVKTCEHFGEKYWASFFGQDAEEPGLPLPFAHENFPMKIRGGELTLLLGKTKVGKSTLLSWIALNLMHHGQKVFIASMEMRPEVTLKIMASQLIGKNKLEDCAAHHDLAKRALNWLNSRIVIYDFLGITDWRELLAAKRYAAEFMGCNFFITDSMMRLGIVDDDYPQQGQVVTEFMNFCQAYDVHEVLINHMNKSDISRGSQQVLDNAANIWRVSNNPEKQEKIDELKQEREELFRENKFKGDTADKWTERRRKLDEKWDSKFSVTAQRWPGSRQNGSIYLWFDSPSQQLRSKPTEPVGVNYLDRWTRNRAVKEQPQQQPTNQNT